MNKWSEIFLGLILVVGIILVGWFSATNGWTIFGKNLDLLHSAWILLKGAFFWIVLMIGFLLIVLGISDLKN